MTARDSSSLYLSKQTPIVRASNFTTLAQAWASIDERYRTILPAALALHRVPKMSIWAKRPNSSTTDRTRIAILLISQQTAPKFRGPKRPLRGYRDQTRFRDGNPQ